MSDFGCMVLVHRVDGTDVTPADETLVKRAAKDLVIGPGDRLSDFADYELKFGGSASSPEAAGEGVMVGLTEYMVGDEIGNDGWDEEAILARDRPLAERFGEELQEIIGPAYTVQTCCDFW